LLGICCFKFSAQQAHYVVWVILADSRDLAAAFTKFVFWVFRCFEKPRRVAYLEKNFKNDIGFSTGVLLCRSSRRPLLHNTHIVITRAACWYYFNIVFVIFTYYIIIFQYYRSDIALSLYYWYCLYFQFVCNRALCRRLYLQCEVLFVTCFLLYFIEYTLIFAMFDLTRVKNVNTLFILLLYRVIYAALLEF